MPSKKSKSKSKSKSKAKTVQNTPEVQDVPEVVETVEQEVVEQVSEPEPVKSKSKKKKAKVQDESAEASAEVVSETPSKAKKSKKTAKSEPVAETEPVSESVDESVAETPTLTRSQALKAQRKYENSTVRNLKRFTKMLERLEKSVSKSGSEKDMSNFQTMKELFNTIETDFNDSVTYSSVIRETSRPKKKVASNTTGFVEKKPQPLLYMSPQLKTLLSAVKDEGFKLGEDNMIQRGDAVKGISLYVKENELKNAETKEIEYKSKSKDNMLYTLKEVTKDGQTAQIQSSKGEKVSIASPTAKTFTQKDIFSLVAGHVSKVPF